MQGIVNVARHGRLFRRTLLRQVHFPPLWRGIAEAIMFSAVFLAAGSASLGHGVAEMLGPMVPVVLAMMLCSAVSGVYRPETARSIVSVYVHSAYGFLLSTIAVLVVVSQLAPVYADPRFVSFFLFFAFFVTNAVRPLISGTDFVDGGGRRGN